jgi:hypothetical protein
MAETNQKELKHDHGKFSELEYGECEKFTECRDTLKETLLATLLIILLVLTMTVWELI